MKATQGNTPDQAALWMEALLGGTGVLLAVLGMALEIASGTVDGAGKGLADLGLWLLALGPVAAVAASAGWAVRARRPRTALLALVALAAIALAAFILPTS